MLTVKQDKPKAPTLAVVALDVSDMHTLDAPGTVGHKDNGQYHARTLDMSRDYLPEGWYGGISTLAEARSLMTDGWTEGNKRASGLSAGIGEVSAQPASIRRRWVRSDEGDTLDIERAMRGDWDTAYLSQKKRRTSGNRIVSLVGCFGGNCNRSADELFWNAIQLVVTADLLEQAGYQCEVRAVVPMLFHESGPGTGLVEVTVKQPGQPLRTDVLISTFAHAGVWRTYGFMAVTAMPWPVGSCLGQCQELATPILAQMVDAKLTHGADVVVEPAYTKEAAIKGISKAVTAATQKAVAA